jgi:hypothetical protein
MTLPAVSLGDGSFCLATSLNRTTSVGNGSFNASAESFGSSVERIS